MTTTQFDDMTPTCIECRATKSILVFATLDPPVCESCDDDKAKP